MFDHVTLRVSDLGAARAFYETALAVLGYREPGDLRIEEARPDRPATRHLHVGLAARSHELVDEFWRKLMARGFRDHGPPGLRELYSQGYYGSFALDPDDNSIEAVYKEQPPPDGGCVDHVWLRVRDVGASKRFYETIGPGLGFRFLGEGPARAHFGNDAGGFTVTSPDDDWSVRRALTENAHLAFPAAGYRTSGELLRDPDGNTVEAVART